MLRTCFLLATLVAIANAGGHDKHKCGMGTSHQHSSYPPPNTPLKTGESRSVPWHVVDLDQPAATRWVHVVQPQKAAIKALTDVINETMEKLLGRERFAASLKRIDAKFDSTYIHQLPPGYGDEIKGIAAATGLDTSIIFVYNMFYTVFGACTSIVAEDQHGGKFHARNLDFGLWPALNISHGNVWELTSRLRPLVINVDLQRNNKTLYKSTTFNGFIGVHTALKPGIFSATIDTRFDTGFDVGLLEWILLGRLDKASEITMALRQMFESSSSYETGLATLNQTTLLGPGYIILGGPKADQGMVLTKGATRFGREGRTVHEVSLASQAANGSHFLVQTNYDGDADGTKPPSKIDNRRDPAKACMKQIGPNGTGFANLYGLLSSTPNLNRLTAYTTLMNIQTGQFETYRQLCDTLDCPFW